MQNQQPLHVASPLRQSLPLTKEAGTAVYLKLDSSQPTGSFKIRGIGHLCQTVGAPGSPVCVRRRAQGIEPEPEPCLSRPSTGGNAGMAAAYSARQLGVPATIVVPSVTPDLTVERLRDQGATVVVHGKALNDSIVHGQQLVENNPGWVFISPFDDPLIWEGHSSLVKELQQELREKPGAIVLSGLRRAAWGDVPVVAMETRGAHSLNAAVKAGELVTLPEITSVATTLGLARVSERTFALVQEHPVFSEVVTDQDAVAAVERFIDDEKILVEPACGAALAAVYSGVLRRLQEEGKLAEPLGGPVVVVVCGGNNISVQQLQKLKQQLGLPGGGHQAGPA
uniref:L-serine ammonia-lyase n=1 Tax=Takifugu rubripes TaxID=31033 RepID=A0A674P452_TAKRU